MEEACEDGLAGGVGGVGDDSEAAAGHGAGDDGVFHVVVEFRDEGGEVGDGGIVVKGGEGHGAEHEGGFAETPEHGADPPLLEAAVDDEAGEEESDEDGGAELEGVLVVLGDFVEGEEEEEAADEEGGVVGVKDGPGHEGEVDGGDPEGDGVIGVRGRGAWAWLGGAQLGEVAAEGEGVEGGSDGDADRGDPAELVEHEGGGPFPGAGDHEHGGCGEVREDAADGDVDEEEAEGGVGEAGRGTAGVELAGEEEGGDGHGGGFGDERAEEGAEGEDGEPPGGGSAAAELGDGAEAAFGELEDGAGGGDGHDDDDEEGFFVVHAVVEVVEGGFPAGPEDEEEEEGEAPDAEHGLDLAEEVEDAWQHGVGGGGLLGGDAGLGLVAFLEEVGPMAKLMGEEGMEDGAEEEEGGPEVEGFLLDTVLEDGADALERGVVIAFEAWGNGGGGGGGVCGGGGGGTGGGGGGGARGGGGREEGDPREQEEDRAPTVPGEWPMHGVETSVAGGGKAMGVRS